MGSYSIDIAYSNCFRDAAHEKYHQSLLRDRLITSALASSIALVAIFRLLGRVINCVVEVAKVIFYFLVSCVCCHQQNFKRLKDHAKLLLLNSVALIIQPLQTVVHTMALIIGLVTTRVANYMMHTSAACLGFITSCEHQIWQNYDTPVICKKSSAFIQSKMTKRFKKSSHAVRAAMTTMINEFSAALDSALVAPLGFMTQFHCFGANPQKLEEAQKKLTPILLLNGNYSHQATFLPLLHALKSSKNQHPVYTINLPPDTTEPSFLESKIKDIKKQYDLEEGDDLEISLIGHSMGSNLIQKIAPNDKLNIKHAITIGTPFLSDSIPNVIQHAFDIVATKDLLVKEKSKLAKDHRKKIETGHLGLLFHPQSLQVIQNVLKK